ncbi:MAG: YitT family protein [Desulfonatronovibrionaceae bacterium]
MTQKRILPFISSSYKFRALSKTLFYQLLIGFGAILAGLGYTLFQVPFDLAAGGLSGLGIIINEFTGLPVGMLYLVMNIPLLVLGYFYLGKWRFIFSTSLAVICFSAATDIFGRIMPEVLRTYPITEDVLLSAIYAGLVYGLGVGIIFRAGGTIGGTSITGRILHLKLGCPLSQAYLYTDGAIIFLAGLVFGWEKALLALITLFFCGFTSDFVLEGASHVRTALIITDKPAELRRALMSGLNRGITYWSITGGYTDSPHTMLYCTISRSQVTDLKYIVGQTDPYAFTVIGVAQQALGGGFKLMKEAKR